MSTGPKLPAPPVVGRPSDSTLTRVGGEPSPLLEEGGRPLELRTTAPDPAPPQIPAPTLLDLPDNLFPIEQSLDPDALALPPLRSPERWRQHADALLAEARAAHDAADNNGNSEAVRVAMSGEAGRIYLQQLGQRSTGEPLLTASSPAVRRSAEHSATITHLADELDGLAKQADDRERPISLRAATWIEHGQRAE